LTKKDLVVGIDLGGTKFRACLADTAGSVLRRESWPTEAEQGPQAVMARLREAVREIAAGEGLERVAGIGFGAPGPLDPWQGIIIQPPNLPGWDRVPLREEMQRDLGVPVYVGNDANLAALGELFFGAGRGLHNIVYFTVSTGVGGGVIVDDRLLLGSTGLAAELGHMVVDASGPLCNCGNSGCLEVLASGTAIAREARAGIRKGVSTLITSLVQGEDDEVDALVVEKAARQGDPFAAKLMETAARYMGIGIVNALHIFDPEMVIIGGGVSQAGDLLFRPMLAEVKRRAMKAYWEKVSIVPAGLGDDSGLMGALALAISETRR
jgi:glucokinase